MSEKHLRHGIIRLAHSNPELRPHLLPLLASTKPSPDDLAWFKDTLLRLMKKAGAKVIKDNGRSLFFSFPKHPEVRDVVFSGINRGQALIWISSLDGVQGWGWDSYKPGRPYDPSNPLNIAGLVELPYRDKVMQSLVEGIVGQVEEVRNVQNIQVTGLKQLKRKPTRGWTTNPNFSEATIYEVLGTGLQDNAASHKAILKWLSSNKKELLPGTHDLGHGASTEVHLKWDQWGPAWFVVSRFSYWGG